MGLDSPGNFGIIWDISPRNNGKKVNVFGFWAFSSAPPDLSRRNCLEKNGKKANFVAIGPSIFEKLLKSRETRDFSSKCVVNND